MDCKIKKLLNEAVRAFSPKQAIQETLKDERKGQVPGSKKPLKKEIKND